MQTLPFEMYYEISNHLTIKWIPQLIQVNKLLNESELLDIGVYHKCNKRLPPQLYNQYTHNKAEYDYYDTSLDADHQFTLLDHEHCLYIKYIEHTQEFRADGLIVITMDKNHYYRLYEFRPCVDTQYWSTELYYDEIDYDVWIVDKMIKYTNINDFTFPYLVKHQLTQKIKNIFKGLQAL